MILDHTLCQINKISCILWQKYITESKNARVVRAKSDDNLLVLYVFSSFLHIFSWTLIFCIHERCLMFNQKWCLVEIFWFLLITWKSLSLVCICILTIEHPVFIVYWISTLKWNHVPTSEPLSTLSKKWWEYQDRGKPRDF